MHTAMQNTAHYIHNTELSVHTVICTERYLHFTPPTDSTYITMQIAHCKLHTEQYTLQCNITDLLNVSYFTFKEFETDIFPLPKLRNFWQYQICERVV